MFKTTTFHYDIAAPETPSSPAAAMATMGSKVEAGAPETSAPVITTAPIPSTETSDSAKSAAPPATVETTTPAPAATATPEIKLAETAIVTAPAVTTPDWREVLKSQQPDAILKEMGFDEQVAKFAQQLKGVDPKVVAFLNHWQTNGDVKAYFEAISTDYSKMPAEDVMRHQLRQEYPELSKEDFDILYADRVTDRYKIDPELYSEEEVRKGNVLLAADTKKIRENLSKSQQDYLLPKAPDASAAAVSEQENLIQRQQQAQEAYKAEILNDSYTKDILSNKRIAIGQGEDLFNYEANTEAIQNVLTDSTEWAKAVFKEVPQSDGTTKLVADPQKQWLIGAIATDPEFMTKLSSHYKALGAKAANDLLENAKKPEGTPARSEAKPASAAGAMAKGGRVVSSY